MAVRESYSIKSDRERRSAPTIVKLFVLVYFWSLIGFALGTVTLLGPVRWWATFCRERAFSEGFESGGVVTLILILVAVSFSLSLWASTEWVRSPSILLKLFLPFIVLGAGYYAYSWWINPESMSSSMGEEQVASLNFTFGPYPDEARLRSLKREGYTAVISLLHPAVVPFEPQLIERERTDSAKVGIEMIHLPMLPWVSDNVESLAKLQELAEAQTGRYYIHCYLGEDRVNVARRIIETTAGVGAILPGTDTRKQIVNKSAFERGEIYSLDGDVYLTPYPTDEEFGSYFLGGQISTVIVMDEPKPGEDSTRIDTERELLLKFKIGYELVPIGAGNYDPAVMLDAVSLAKNAKKPVVVHAYFPPSHKHGGIPQAFLQAYVSGKPPVPPNFFDQPLKNGEARVIAPNIVTGPVPDRREWKRLYQRGVRTVIFAGSSSQVVGAHRAGASGAGLEFKADESVGAVLELLGSGGPYYVYGPGTDAIVDQAAERYGPAVPHARRHDS